MRAVAVIVAGTPGGIANGLLTTILSPIKAGLGGLASLGLSAVVPWVISGARAALVETAHLIGVTTAPQLTSTWFSATYWRVGALAALLTIPFLCAAAVQSIFSSNLAALSHAALIQLPVAVLGVSLAAPVVMLLLAATDQMCTVVSGAGVEGGAQFLVSAAAAAGTLSSIDGSPFFAVAVALFTATAAIALTIEMLVREAAVYVVVLMLPLVFAALVWPARRIWAVRLLELLVGLILSKFVIVAVLSLAGAAYGNPSGPSASRVLTAMALVLLSTFAPWAMLRLLPFAELAAGAAGALSGHAHRILEPDEQRQKQHGSDNVDALLAHLQERESDQAQRGSRTPDMRSGADGSDGWVLRAEDPAAPSGTDGQGLGGAAATAGPGNPPAEAVGSPAGAVASPAGAVASPAEAAGSPVGTASASAGTGVVLGSRIAEMGPAWLARPFTWPETRLAGGLGGGAPEYRDDAQPDDTA